MSDTQLKAFNQSAAGKVVGLCLENVRLGYSIAAKYADAWEAWENTDQHTGTPPTGVDVPAFFSYDGVTNGHVGVNLANGQFWSDGIVYASIAAFEVEHTPKYVGWGTNIDGVPVAEIVATPPPAVASPAPTPPAPAASKIFLPAAAGLWRVYKEGGPYTTAYAIDKLNPGKFPPGLDYEILATLAPFVYLIPTEDFGNVAIYGGPDTIAQITHGA